MKLSVIWTLRFLVKIISTPVSALKIFWHLFTLSMNLLTNYPGLLMEILNLQGNTNTPVRTLVVSLEGDLFFCFLLWR